MIPERLKYLAAGVLIGGAIAGAAVAANRAHRRYLATVAAEATAEQGLIDFTSLGMVSTGFGPAYNGISCASCHNTPAIGGSGTVTVPRVARRNPDGSSFNYPGGPFAPLFSINRQECQPVIPADANVFARRIPLSTFGSALVERIPDAAILALADPDDRNGDGIRGRAALIKDRSTGTMRVGRFGWKAQHATLIEAGAEAYLHEMGLTSSLYPEEAAILGVSAERAKNCDAVADPEDVYVEGSHGIDKFAKFMQSLPAPSPGPETADTRAGADVFASVGCATCHRPSVGDARAYSDFLLHDIGTSDGIEEGAAAANEMRTPALWGIRSRRLLLHDGSATSVDQAISRHEGEATLVKARFFALSAADRQRLLAFAGSR